MMSANISIFNEDLFLNPPPSFYGESFESWKERFEIFIKSNDFEMLNLLINVPFIPTF